MVTLPSKRFRAPQTKKEMLAHLTDTLEILGRKSGKVGLDYFETALLDLSQKAHDDYRNSGSV